MRAGIENLSNIVRKLKLAGHIYGYHQIGRQAWLCNGYAAKEKWDVRPGNRHSRRICRR